MEVLTPENDRDGMAIQLKRLRAFVDAAQAIYDAKLAKAQATQAKVRAKKKRMDDLKDCLFDAVEAFFDGDKRVDLDSAVHPDESLNQLWQAYLTLIEEIDA